MNGAELIAAERERQISEEGWTPEHDAEYDDAELPLAATSYLMYSIGQQELDGDDLVVINLVAKNTWPWAKEWWKPSEDPVRNLTKAGALIAAEIDRLQANADVRV